MKRIILNESQVKAVLETGRVVVRRVVKPLPDKEHVYCRVVQVGPWYHIEADSPTPVMHTVTSPFGNVGDKVWVAETWSEESIIMGWATRPVYKADGIEYEVAWKSPITMSRKTSRLTLDIMSVAVERGDKWEWVYELKRVE